MLPEEISRFAGKVISTSALEVERGAIRRFADAVGDSNPLYWDEEYARKSKYGSIIAPPGFFGWPVMGGNQSLIFSLLEGELGQALLEVGYNTTSAIDGGTSYEFFQPIRAGDTLTASLAIRDIAERRSQSGRALFIIFETTYTNQNGALVAKERGTFIHPDR
jgi:acyl dehydratase